MSDWSPFGSASLRVIVAVEDGLDPRCVGTVMDEDTDEIIGVLSDLPAAELGMEEVARLTGMKVNWDKYAVLCQLADEATFLQELPPNAHIERRKR